MAMARPGSPFIVLGMMISYGFDPSPGLIPYYGGKTRARIFKLLRSPRFKSKEPITPGCVAWRAGTTTLFLIGF